MKKALLLCLLPFLGYATQLKKGTNATVFIDGISYNRGTLTPVFTFSTDTFLQIQQNGSAVVIPIRKYSFYTDGDHGNVAFSSGAKLMLWCDSFINTPTYAIQQYLLANITPVDTGLLLHKADSAHYITPYYFNSNIPVLTGYVPYTGAAHDLQLGNHVLTANSGTYNTEVGTDLFGVENNAVTKYSVLTVDGLTVNSTVPATTMTVTDSGLIFPNGGVQTYKADSVTYVTPYYYNAHLPASIDTTSLSTRINARVKYTDTSTMLSPYLRNDSTIYVTPTRLADTADTLRAYTDNQIAAAQAGYVNYYFDTTHNGTYRTLTPNYNYATQTKSYTSVVNNQILDSFVTASLVPSQYTLRAGYYNFHIHATQTSGTKTTELYFALYTMDTTGVKTLQGTSGYTTALSNSDNGYTSDIYILNDVLINLKDRFLVKVIASVTGGGSAPNITLKVMDNTVAGMYAPSQGVSSARYIPWTDTLSSSRYVVTPTYLGSLGYGTGTVTNVGSGYGTNFTAITGTGNVVVDSISQSTRAWRQKAVDSLNATIATKGSGTVTSVTGGRGLTGGVITTTGTLGFDTTLGYAWSTGQTLVANSLHTTPVAGITLQNLTSATAGFTNEVSNSIDLKAGYYTGGVAHTSTIRVYNNPNASSSTGEFSLWSSIDGGAFSRFAYIGAAGNFSLSGGTFGGAVTFNSSLTMAGVLNAANIIIVNGRKLTFNTSTNGCAGSATLSSGTVTITNNIVTASSIIQVTYQSGTTPTTGIRSYFRVSTITAGVSFVIVAESAAGTTNTTDNSVISWVMIN
jgi:hypothetical protein